MWHPFVQKTDTLYVFNTELCRSIYIRYIADKTVSASKIPVYRFAAPAMVMASADINSDNKGFCYPDSEFCLKSGVIDVSPCKG